MLSYEIYKIFKNTFFYEKPPVVSTSFSSATGKNEFPQILGLHRKTENHKAFHFRLLPRKSNDSGFYFIFACNWKG